MTSLPFESAVAFSTSSAGGTSFWPFFGCYLVFSLLYVPTLSVTNSIAFANLKDPAADFGAVRMGGTVGWVLVKGMALLRRRLLLWHQEALTPSTV